MQRKVLLSPSTWLFLLAIGFALAFVPNAAAKELSQHTAKFVQTAPDMGPADPSQIITVKVRLQGKNHDQLSSFIQQLHDPASPNFQKWLTPDQFKAQFGATAGGAATVQKFLTGHNLKVISSDPGSITVQGTVGDSQNALHTRIDKFVVNGNVVRANISNPIVDEPAGANVSAISGLTEIMAKPHSVVARDASGNPSEPFPLDSSAPPAAGTAQCFGTPNVTVTINAPPNSATYSGQPYKGCFFQPAELQTAYNFNALYSQGLDGTGQAIAIVDAFGSPTLVQDLQVFDTIFGLPAAKLNIFFPNGQPTRTNAGFAGETTLDVEWAHAVAPGAVINLVIAPDNRFSSLNAAVQFAIENNLGPAISNSYGAPENLIDAGTIAETEAIIAEGAAAGVSVNYSSGDDGDFELVEQELNIGIPPGTTTVSYPASSPFATAIGGTSLFVNPDNTLNFQTGWGNNLAQLNAANTFPFPDFNSADGLGFLFGAGGGPSGIFAKQHFQRRQPGDFRQLPDISYLADPQTGVEIVQTVGGRLVGEIIGGTSLSCPLFSALWTIGAQAFGHGNIGQGAQTVYELHDDAIGNIRQFDSPGDVTGLLTTPNGTINLTPADISQPLFGTRRFVSSLAGGRSGQIFNLSFGTDSSLAADEGWDNVTGLGTPNAPEFIRLLVKRLNKGD